MAGRRPKPTALKLLQGNPGGRPLNDAEPQLAKARPEMPKGMGKGARRMFNKWVSELENSGMLARIDGVGLAVAAECFEHIEQLRKDINEHGRLLVEPILDKQGNHVGDVHKENPAFKMWIKASGQLRSFLIEYGLTPASRSKLKVEKPQDDDPMDALMRGRNTPAVGAGVN